MDEAIGIMFIAMWVVTGIYSMIVWWRKDLDVELSSIPMILAFGSTVGIAFGLVMLVGYTFKTILGSSYNKVLLKKKVVK